MLDVLTAFVQELRSAGLPVSLTEELDAMRAVLHVPLEDRSAFRSALAATLVKSAAHQQSFDTLFDIHFSLRGAPAPDSVDDGDADLLHRLQQALAEGDDLAVRELARQAVSRFAGMEAGRPVGAGYYVQRTLRHLDLDALLAHMLDRSLQDTDGGRSQLQDRLVIDEQEARLEILRDEVTAEVRRRLVNERGPQAVGRSSRVTPPREVDFMHATAEELATLRRALYPLGRRLAVRLARKRRHRRGPLDFRSTIRHSLSYGGVPADPRFRHSRPAKPELMVVADISGSVAAFARFTLQLVHALSSQFTRVRSFVFIDGIDEVTPFFDRTEDLSEALRRVGTEADVVWLDGHSDYGHALTTFWERWGREVTPKTTLLVLGDARNNYHAANSWVVAEMAQKARHVYWLNPEPRSYWDTGDSIIGQYAGHCDAVFECRNLRQLERFVEHLG